MSLVTVMMWQPIASAWKMLSSSRGLAQISSAAGATLQQSRRRRPSSAPGRARCRRCGRRTPRRSSARPARALRPTSRTCAERHQRRDVQLHAPRWPAAADQRVAGLASRVGHRDLDVDVARPSSRSRCAWRSISANRRRRPRSEIGRSGIAVRMSLREGAIVGDAGLAHQGGVGGEALDDTAWRTSPACPPCRRRRRRS